MTTATLHLLVTLYTFYGFIEKIQVHRGPTWRAAGWAQNMEFGKVSKGKKADGWMVAECYQVILKLLAESKWVACWDWDNDYGCRRSIRRWRTNIPRIWVIWELLLLLFYIPIRTQAVGSEAFWKKCFHFIFVWKEILDVFIMKQTTKHICSL